MLANGTIPTSARDIAEASDSMGREDLAEQVFEIPEGISRQEERNVLIDVENFVEERGDLFGERSRDIKFLLIELVLNIAQHTRGGTISVSEENGENNKKLIIHATNKGPGLPATPSELLAQSIATRKPESEERAHVGFWRISLDPDKVIINSGKRSYTRITRDENAGNWFKEKELDIPIQGTEFILEYDFPYEELADTTAGDKKRETLASTKSDFKEKYGERLRLGDNCRQLNF